MTRLFKRVFDKRTKTVLLHSSRNFAIAAVMLFFAYCLDAAAEFFERTERSAYLVFMTHFMAIALLGIDLTVMIGTVLIGGYRLLKSMFYDEGD